MGLADARLALVLVERLPQCRAALHRLARRRWVGRTRRGAESAGRRELERDVAEP
jgi:hypothetical protein